MATLEELLRRQYRFEIVPQEEGGFVGIYPELEGCVAQGETLEETLEELEASKALWIEVRYEDGLPIPQSAESLPSGRLTLRLPRSLHGELVKKSDLQEISLNQYVVSLLSRASLESTVAAELSARLDALERGFRSEGAPRAADAEARGSQSGRSTSWDGSATLRQSACLLFEQGGERGRRLAGSLLAELPSERMATFMLGLLYFMAEEPEPGSTAEVMATWENDLRIGWDHVMRAFRHGLEYKEASRVGLSIPSLKPDVLWDRLVYLTTLFADESKNPEVARVISWVAMDQGKDELAGFYDSIANDKAA